MRIWLHSAIDVAPVISKRADGTYLVHGGTFRYRRWQMILSRNFPRIFPTAGLWVPLDGGDERVCGWKLEQLARRFGTLVSMGTAP